MTEKEIKRLKCRIAVLTAHIYNLSRKRMKILDSTDMSRSLSKKIGMLIDRKIKFLSILENYKRSYSDLKASIYMDIWKEVRVPYYS